ncbi:MAG: HD domain-containing protein [Patescibacteria group bacterium]
MKIKITVPEQVGRLLKSFEKTGYEIYIVGGVVRDAMLGRELTDWDFTTNATPKEILRLFPDAYYDNKFGTVGIKSDEGRPLEITTYRTEHGYSDSRHPDKVAWGKSLQEDLARRDFTINAMALTVGMEIIDPFGGQQDVKDKLIRAVGDANQRFGEDALRMMRAIRIAAQLGFTIEEATLQAIQTNAKEIKQISGERIREELFKLLASNYPADGYRLLRSSGLGEQILPEMEKTFGVEQKSPGRHHIYDVGTHSVESLKNCQSIDPITRLATLIHDAGKVRTQKVYPDGRITFYNHEMESARIAQNIADRLRFSKDQKDKFVRLVRWHQFTVNENQTDSAIRRILKNVGLENMPDMLVLRVADRLGGGARATSWRLEEFKKKLVEVQKQPFSVQDLKVNGLDVMKIKKLEPGPMVGKYLEALFAEVEKGLPNEKEVLLKKLKELKF